MVSLRQTGGLETYAGRAASDPAAKAGRPPTARAAAGRTSRAGSRPARPICRWWSARRADFGQVIFLAADLDRPPLSRWSDRRLLAARLLDLPDRRAAGRDEATRTAAPTAISDWPASCAARSTSSPACSWCRSASWSLLVVGYILLIGPGDYFFLRKVVRRMEWTWLTFPASWCCSARAAYVLAYRLKGNQLRVNQVDLVDVDAARARVRGTTWMNVFSPQMESFDLSLRSRGCPTVSPPARPLDHGLAGTARRGPGRHGPRRRPAARRSGAATTPSRPTLDAMDGVPIQVWSTKSLTAAGRPPPAGGCVAGRT